MHSQFNLKNLIELSKAHQEKVKELIDSIYQPTEELLDSSINAVDEKIKSHTFFSINEKTVKKLKTEIDEYDRKFQKRTQEEAENMKKNLEEITKMLRKYIQNLIDILNQISSSYENSSKELQQLLEQIEEQLQEIPKQLVIQNGHSNITIIVNTLAALSIIGLPYVIYKLYQWDISFLEKLSGLSGQLNKQKEVVQEQKYETLDRIKSILDKSIQIFMQNCQIIKEQSIVWYDKDIDNKENSALCQEIKNHFSDIKHFFFTNNLDSLRSYLNEQHIAYLILQGSISETFLESTPDYYNIHSIIIYCFYIKKYISLKEKYQNIRHVVNQQDQLIQLLRKSMQSSVMFFGQINFYCLTNYFKKNPVVHYFSTKFSISELQEINQQNAQEIIKKTLDKCPTELIVLNQTQQDKLVNLIVQKFKQKQNQDIIKLYTMDSDFYKFMNTILSTLNENAILESQLLIKSVNFSLEQYNDKLDNQNFFKKEFRLFRGIKYQIKSFKRDHKIGDLIVFPSFTSTSEKLKTAEQFAGQNGIIFSIKFDKNSWISSQFKKSRPKSIAAISEYPGEFEYLFPSFSCFIIQGFKNNTVELEYIKI